MDERQLILRIKLLLNRRADLKLRGLPDLEEGRLFITYGKSNNKEGKMELNLGLAIIFCILIALSAVSLVFLKITDLRLYFIDTALISICMAFFAAAYFTGIAYFLLGILIYGYRLRNIDNILKAVVLFGGIFLGYLTGNNFYTYSSAFVLAIFTIIRMIESIIEITQSEPKKDNTVHPNLPPAPQKKRAY